MERLERLVNLVAALIDADRPLSREELHRRVGGYADSPEAFRRNFERDKDLLRQMGIPLVLEALHTDLAESQVGYRIPRERYELPDPGLTEDELAALRLATAMVGLEGWGEGAAAGALRKLAGAATGVPAGPTGDSATGFSVTGDAATGEAAIGKVPSATRAPATPLAEVPVDERVAAAFEATLARRLLGFRYRGEERTVEPWRLSYRSGQWYLYGFDRTRAGERLFRLDRLESPPSPEGDSGAFTRPAQLPEGPLPAWQLGEGASTRVELLVDAEQAPWALSAVGDEALAERLPDGSVRLHLEVTSREAFRSFMLGFLDHAEVLSPPDVRNEMVTWLEALTV
ncbi:MAG: helix-turn-helix transcriptional regulator [Acidimicrobiales bacterium]